MVAYLREVRHEPSLSDHAAVLIELDTMALPGDPPMHKQHRVDSYLSAKARFWILNKSILQRKKVICLNILRQIKKDISGRRSRLARRRSCSDCRGQRDSLFIQAGSLSCLSFIGTQ